MREPPRSLPQETLDALRTLADRHLQLGWHSGAQLAVYRDGVLQVDIRCGSASAPDARLQWFSATKPLIAVAMLVLVERGKLSLDVPIAMYWPEFAQGRKHRVTCRDVLLHRGGFPIFPPEFDWDRIDQWEEVCRVTAALTAEWEPGTAVGYHPLTFGFALGEVVRRVDGRSPREFLEQEIFRPLRMDASLGLPDAEHHRVVLLEAKSEVTWQDLEGKEGRTSDIVSRFARPSTLRAQLPAANAIGTAEALARFCAMLERGGELDGVRILRPETIEAATQVYSTSMEDRVTGMPSSFGLGFLVGGPFEPFCEPGVFGHTGQQCTVSYADPRRGLAVAYVTNGLQDPLIVQERTEDVVRVLRDGCK